MRHVDAHPSPLGLLILLPVLTGAEGDCHGVGADAGPLETDAGPEPADAGPEPADPCAVVSIERMEPQLNYGLSPDGRTYFENRRDEDGIYQVYVGDLATQVATCITCEQAPGGPRPGAHKLMVVWHPSGEWLFVGGEHDHWLPPWISPEQDLGMMQSGTNLDMYVTRADGAVWYELIDFGGTGYTGPAVTADGRVYYSEIVSGNIFVYSFGQWRSKRADFVVDDEGVPSLQSIVDVTPPDTHWSEPGNVSADGKYLLWTLDTGLAPDKAAGMDQWIEDLETGTLTNLNNTPDEWDEHGLFAPNSQRIVFMSSHPYPEFVASTALFGIFGLYTEFMMMDLDGGNLVQLTHFHEPGYPESTAEDNVAAVAYFSPDGGQLFAAQLLTGASFPNQVTWTITFAGRCGGDGGF